MKKLLHALFILILFVLIGIGVFRYLDYKKYEPLRTDYERIATEDYNAVFFSTFPINNFTEEDFIFYRDIYPLKASYCIPDMDTLNEYFIRVSESWNEVDTAYLGVRPDIIAPEDLLSLMDSYPDMSFEVIVAYPSLAYWQNLDDEEYAPTLALYTDFVNTIMNLCEDDELLSARLSLYFYNSTEWLVSNSANYESDFNVNEGISHMLSMYSDSEHGYKLYSDNYEEILEDFETLVSDSRTEESEYPDLSDWDVIFFGDSIIAFSETSSIPGAFGGITGANTYNCGRGGSSATALDDEHKGVCGVVDAFIAKDLSSFDEGSLVYKGMSDYMEQSGKLFRKKHQLCFVINYGMNDYYSGYPVRTDDAYDTGSYAGALRTAVEKLQTEYPDAVIVLMTPNFTSYFGNGLTAQSEVGGVLPDYAAAVISLCEEKDLLLYDSYGKLPIDSVNFPEYLLDGTHPNENTRLIMARGLAKLFN